MKIVCVKLGIVNYYLYLYNNWNLDLLKSLVIIKKKDNNTLQKNNLAKIKSRCFLLS